MEPLADGQVWHMPELRMKVDLVGKLLVHYKLAKHNAIRVPNSIGSIVSIEKFLKKNKAVLLPVVVEKIAVKKNGKPAKKTAK